MLDGECEGGEFSVVFFDAAELFLGFAHPGGGPVHRHVPGLRSGACQIRLDTLFPKRVSSFRVLGRLVDPRCDG